MKVWREGTTASQAIRDNWARDIPLMQTRTELYAYFGIVIPIDVLGELYLLYDFRMKTEQGE